MRQQGWLRILAFLAFSWVAFLLVTVKLVRQQDSNDGDSSQRLARALRELDKLHRSNAELNALVLDLNYNPRIDNKKILLSYFQNSKQSGLNGPSEEYELTRRRIFSNTKELWYYVNSELQSLVKEDDGVRVEHISKIKNIIGEHYRSLLKDVSSLADVDGHAVWRQQESENLSNLVQKRLKHLQNPSDCTKARKLVCDLNKGCGYGCQLHHVVYCFIVAYATERTLILRSKGWRYSKGGWQDVFLPLSDTCLLPNGETTNRWPGHQNTQVITLPIIDSINPRPPFLPLALPEDLAPRLNVLHGDPVVWWIGQFLKYMLRPQPATSNKLDEYAKKVKFQKPIVGVHIRRTDKVGTEAAFHKLDEYMVHVEQYYKYKELTDKVNKKRVYLATDEPKLFSEAKRKYPEYEIIGDEDISKTASISKRYSDQSLSGIITDIHFLSLSDYLVCTFSSQVCRVAYEIMNSLHPDASTLYTSLDDIYYYGGQKRRLHVAVLPHKANGPHEMNLLVGDEIAVAGNHWDGYSKGTNLRTKESGLYPTFKVSPKIETALFASYPDVTLSTNELQEKKRGLLYNDQSNMQTWGLIVLLVSKAAGHINVESSADEDKSGVLRSQRALAEIAEMIRTSHLMHNGLINIYPKMFLEPASHDDMSFGNKIGLLSGDYLLANSFHELSMLKNQNLMELISSALRDLSEAEFLGRRDSQNNPLPSPFEPLDRNLDSSRLRFDPLQPSELLRGDMPLTPALCDWTRRNVLSAGSLLGKSCQGALLLAGHSEQWQKQGFLFGKHLSLAWQAYLDLEPFLSGSPYSLGISFNLTSAPVMFHLEHDSSLFKEIDKGINSIQDVDYVKVHDVVLNGPGINYTKQLQKEHSEKAMEVLNVFEESDAKTALSNIIVAMNRK